jgi:CheY-like chemotaxis protein
VFSNINEDKYINLNNATWRRDMSDRILLVEDSLTSIKLMKLFLKDICDVDHAMSGESAFEMACRSTYDAILIDMNLGNGLNGIQTSLLIRKMQCYKSTPIAAMSVFGPEDEKEIFNYSGFTDLLVKPFEVTDLIDLVSNMLKRPVLISSN